MATDAQLASLAGLSQAERIEKVSAWEAAELEQSQRDHEAMRQKQLPGIAAERLADVESAIRDVRNSYRAPQPWSELAAELPRRLSTAEAVALALPGLYAAVERLREFQNSLHPAEAEHIWRQVLEGGADAPGSAS